MRLKITEMKYFFIAAILFLAMSCNHAEKHMEQIADSLAVNSDTTNADSAVIAPTPAISSTHYAGTIPCADCTGIETEITLTSDHTYSVHSIYTGRKSTGPGSNEFSETGMWMLHGADTIHLADRKNGPSMYLRTDSSLVQLDMKGKKITGKLADKYMLKQIK
jgi:uncharacterized lipoprotein NlpE involved in copper resistance